MTELWFQMRAIFEALGATVTWDETTQTAIAVKDVNTIKITIDSNINVQK